MVTAPASAGRIPPQSKAKSRRKCAIQLDFFDEINENGGQTETPVLVAPTPPNQGGEVSSTMISHHSTLAGPTPTSPRKTYSQNWPAYNAAQIAEKSTFMRLLGDQCSTVAQPREIRRGHPRLPLGDVLFATTLKVYSGFSARRFSSDVRDAQAKGFTDSMPHFNSVNRYIADPDMAPILVSLIEQSALPLRPVETTFAIDASGFSTSRFAKWYDHKWQKERKQRHWLKAHIVTGVRTNIITSVGVTDKDTHDSQMFEALVRNTAAAFDVRELVADKAYLSDNALTQIASIGAESYIPFKSNTTGKGSPTWERLYAYFVLNQAEWSRRYHQRSNVETTFSMVKGKFGDSVRAKSETGQANEILLKFLCHNLVVLVHEIHELGINPDFGSAASVASEPQIIDLNQYRLQMGL